MTIPDELLDQLAERAADILEARLARRAGKSKYVTPLEAAQEILGCKRQRVYELLRSGRLTRYQDEGRVLLLREEVEDYVARTATRVAA